MSTEYSNQLHSYTNEFNSATVYLPQQAEPADENNRVLYKDTSSPFDPDKQQNRLDYESRLRKDLEPLQVRTFTCYIFVYDIDGILATTRMPRPDHRHSSSRKDRAVDGTVAKPHHKQAENN